MPASPLANTVIRGSTPTGLTVTTRDGRPARLAVLDEDGNVIADGPVDREDERGRLIIMERNTRIEVQEANTALPPADDMVTVTLTIPRSEHAKLLVFMYGQRPKLPTVSPENDIEALHRLWRIANGHSGQCRYVAAFLLGLYNGNRFPFDLTSLRALDDEIVADCLAVLAMDSRPSAEVHVLLGVPGQAFEELAADWRIRDRRLA